MTRRIIIAAALAAALVALVPAGANAAPIRECGNSGRSTENVTTRNLNCSDARRMAKRIIVFDVADDKVSRWQQGRYRCRATGAPGSRPYLVDVRCTFWIYVLRFQRQSGE